MVVAIYLDVRPADTVDHPFAAVDVVPGQVAEVELKQVPPDLFEAIDLEVLAETPLGRTVRAGEPVLVSDLAPPVSIPAGSFLVELPVPVGSGVGDHALVVFVGSEDEPVPGLVTSVSFDEYGEPMGNVAVPGPVAAEVARAGAIGEAMVVLGERGRVPGCSTPSCGG